MSQSWCTVVLAWCALLLIFATQWSAAVDGCSRNLDCPDDEICINNKLCVNVCEVQGLCGINAYCTSRNHDFHCKCHHGYEPEQGRTTGCLPYSKTKKNQYRQTSQNYWRGSQQPIDDVIDKKWSDRRVTVKPGCSRNLDCPDDQICINNKFCVNVCGVQGLCGINAYCTSRNHDFKCKCHHGYEPDQRHPTGCLPSSKTKKHQYPQNAQNDWRGSQQTRDDVIDKKGSDHRVIAKPVPRISEGVGPCRNYCAANAECSLFSNIPLCGCLKGFVGNPYDKNEGCREAAGQVDDAVCWSEDRKENMSKDCIIYAKENTRKKFTIRRDKASWMQAAKLCEVENKMLAIIENRYEQDTLTNQLMWEGVDKELVWLAGSDLKMPGLFQWVYGNTFNRMRFTHWKHNEPSSGRNQHCLAMLERYDWGSRDCQEEHFFVCQNKKRTAV